MILFLTSRAVNYIQIICLCCFSFLIVQCKPAKQSVSAPVVVIEKKDTAKTPETVKETSTPKAEDTIHIYAGFLMPFALQENLKPAEDDLQPEELFAPSLQFLEFYEGAKMAADSFQNEFLKVHLKAYDTADSLIGQTIWNNTKIYTNDVLFAANPIPANSLLKNAEKNNCPVIWTHTTNLKSKELMLIQPNNQTMINAMATYLAVHFADVKITMVYRDTKKEKELADHFAAQIDTAMITENGDSTKVLKVNYSVAKAAGLISKLSKTDKNLIVVASSDEAFVSPLVKALYDTCSTYKIQLCGLPTWENFESVNVQELQKLQTLIFSNNYINYNDEEMNNFRKAFISKYFTDPVYQAYQGFFLMKGLMNIKTIKQNWNTPGIEKSFKTELFNFNPASVNGGYENNFITVLKFDNYKLVKQ